MTFFIQMLVTGIVVGSIYGLVALGFVLIYRARDALNLANGELVLIGAYVSVTLITVYNVPLLLAILITLFINALTCLAIERFVIWPLLTASVISVIMATLGLSSLLGGVAQVIWGPKTMSFSKIFPDTPVKLGSV